MEFLRKLFSRPLKSSLPALKLGDVIIVRSKSPMAKVIDVLSKWRSKDPVYYTHAAVVYDDKTILQAEMTIQLATYDAFFTKYPNYKVIRYSLLSNEQLLKIQEEGKSLLGNWYGVPRLFAEFFNVLCGTRWFGNCMTSKDNQICSSVVAYLYSVATGFKFNGIDWTSCEPDDIDDEVLKLDSDFFEVTKSLKSCRPIKRKPN